MPTTPNMSLVTPTEGGSTGIWDTLLNAIFDIIDAHSHASGSGVKVTPAGLNVNAALEFNSNSATEVKSVELESQTVGGVNSNALWRDSTGDLYWKNGAGLGAQVTDGAYASQKHGTRTKMFSAAGSPGAWPTWDSANGAVQSTAGSQEARIPLPLDVGDTIETVRVYARHGAAGTITATLRDTGTTGGATSRGTANDVGGGAGDATITISSISHTVASGGVLWLDVDSGAAADKIYAVEVDYSRS